MGGVDGAWRALVGATGDGTLLQPDFYIGGGHPVIKYVLKTCKSTSRPRASTSLCTTLGSKTKTSVERCGHFEKFADFAAHEVTKL